MPTIPSTHPVPFPAAPPAARGQALATAASSNGFTLTVDTRDGDTVTISAFQGLAAAAAANGNARSLHFLAAEGMSIAVQGELDGEELAALAALVSDLAEVGSAFYAGDTGSAVAKALALPDYGPLAGFSATFVRRDYLRLQEAHPLPAGLPAPSLPPLPATPLATDGSWQEAGSILERLGEEMKEDHASLPPAVPLLPAAGDLAAFLQAVDDRLRAFLAERPRLSPLLPAAAAQGLDRAARELPPEAQGAARRFHGQLVRRIAGWLSGVPA